MKVAFIALSTRGAMGQYVAELTSSLGQLSKVYLFVPKQYEVRSCENVIVNYFETGTTKMQALLRMLNPLRAWKLWRDIYRVNPEVIHLFNGEGYPLAIALSFFLAWYKIPLIVTVHDPQPHPGNLIEAISSFLRRIVLRRASAIHIHSALLRRSLKNANQKKVFVIPHGSLDRQFTAHKVKDIKRERLALFFGRLEKYKGLESLVEAGLSLKGGIRIAIAGPGQLPRPLLNTINSNPHIFELHNYFLSNSEVASLFQRASVCVLPYKQASQSSVPLIAAAFGVPVVATPVGALSEDVTLIRGVMAQPADPQGLARAIKEAENLKVIFPKGRTFDSLSVQFQQMYENVGSR